MEDALLKELAAARSHTVTMSLLHFVVLLAVLIGGGWFVHHELTAYATQWATTEQHYQEFIKDSQAAQQKIVEASKQQSQLDINVHQRNDQTDKQIQSVAAPDRSTTQVQADAKTILGVDSDITPDNKLAFKPWDVQSFVVTKLDRDRLSSNLTDTEKKLELEQGKTATLQASLTQATTVAKDERKIAQMSKWHRVWNKAEPWAIAIGTTYVANKLSKR